MCLSTLASSLKPKKDLLGFLSLFSCQGAARSFLRDFYVPSTERAEFYHFLIPCQGFSSVCFYRPKYRCPSPLDIGLTFPPLSLNSRSPCSRFLSVCRSSQRNLASSAPNDYMHFPSPVKRKMLAISTNIKLPDSKSQPHGRKRL